MLPMLKAEYLFHQIVYAFYMMHLISVILIILSSVSRVN